jgi:hypothetical protein
MPFEDPSDQAALDAAYHALEDSDWIIDLANLIGKPIDFVMKKLPSKASEIVENATAAALKGALKLALSTMDLNDKASASPWWHRTLITLTGGIGGLFGLSALPVELPVSTTIILRSIADIARAEGEDLQNPEASLACIEVFALGGRSKSDDSSESGYFAVRAALGRAVSEAAAFVVERGAIEEAPVLIRLIQKIAQRFAPAVADKLAAQAAPVLGALGGATINYIFLNHFQRVAQGHFTVRRLERKYGEERVREEYERVRVK